MIRKIASLSVLALVLVAGSFLAGCQTSNAQPYSVTGASSVDRARFTDDKGHFHADLVAQNRPLR